jgi:hypothetical protein
MRKILTTFGAALALTATMSPDTLKTAKICRCSTTSRRP